MPIAYHELQVVSERSFPFTGLGCSVFARFVVEINQGYYVEGLELASSGLDPLYQWGIVVSSFVLGRSAVAYGRTYGF